MYSPPTPFPKLLKGVEQMGLRDILSRNVKRLREVAGLTQEQLARKAQVNPNYIGKLESKPQNVTIDVVERLAKALKCPVEQLIGGIETVQVNSKETLDLLDEGLDMIKKFRSKVELRES